MADQARWWEQYYVRYFVGTAFAVPLLLMLAQQEPWQTAFKNDSSQTWLTGKVLLLSVGLHSATLPAHRSCFSTRCARRFPARPRRTSPS